MILDHVGYNCANFQASLAFYRAALAPLDIGLTETSHDLAMFGRDGKPQFWIGSFGPGLTGIHVAFAARSREEVRRFHAAALAAGGRDNGAPGLRPQYHADYYAAFVFDPDGHNVEAVCHVPE